MTGTSWNADRAAVSAAVGLPTPEQLAGELAAVTPETYDRWSQPTLRVGTHNGRPCYLQTDGRPAMFLD